MTFSTEDHIFMRRALDLAANGRGHVSPNPMVGAVITDRAGRIIGEGWHRRFGGPHAEVNAVRSVSEADRALLHESTIYVTLEPCSHYGKTPPCAKLLTECGFARVVVGAGDPNPRVSGRGIAMIREAGIRVDTGLLADESVALNRTFMTAQQLRRPFVTLKWAQSADGFMDCRRGAGEPAARFSTQLSRQLVHFRRACHDAIAVGAGTAIADNPSLTVRDIWGNSPKAVIFDRHGLTATAPCAIRDRAIIIDGSSPLDSTLGMLFSEHGITSLLVEGGPSLLRGFINSGLWDEAFVETAPFSLGERGTAPAPVIASTPAGCMYINQNRVNFYSHTSADGVKNI